MTHACALAVPVKRMAAAAVEASMVERSAKRTDRADFTENPQKLGRVWPDMVHQMRREAASGGCLQTDCQVAWKLQTRIRDRVSFITKRKT
jgi:hypothetical protein